MASGRRLLSEIGSAGAKTQKNILTDLKRDNFLQIENMRGPVSDKYGENAVHFSAKQVNPGAFSCETFAEPPPPRDCSRDGMVVAPEATRAAFLGV
eukprot:jgi/Bigna1/144556/aug1.88_g19264